MATQSSNLKQKRKYTAISLFTGCGGLDLGFVGGFDYLGKNYTRRKFDISWANDIDEPSCLTFRRNFKHNIICSDINGILKGRDNALLSHPPIPQRVDVVLGGFPCQDFSLAGKRRGFDSDRGVLYKSMVEVVRRSRPAVFVAENVKGLLSMQGGEAIKIIENDFKKLGYEISTQLHMVAGFGVPQSRERVIIVGTDKRRGLPKFEHPKPILSKEKWITLKQAIGDLENLQEGKLPNHHWSKAKMFEGTQGNSYVSSESVGPTMRAEHHGNIEWHWNKKRRLSAREAARIQSFPDDFVFLPSTSSAYKQIGNAVPPVFAWHIATAVQKFLDKYLPEPIELSQRDLIPRVAVSNK